MTVDPKKVQALAAVWNNPKAKKRVQADMIFEAQKKLTTAKTQAGLAARPFEVRSQGPSGEALESRYPDLEAAKAHADRIPGKSAHGAIVLHEGKVVYTARKK